MQRSGRRFRQPDLVVLYLPGSETCTRLGLTVSRKVGKAVVRNRVKRWLREAARHELPTLDRGGSARTWDLVFIARPSAATSGAAALQQQVAEAFRYLARRRSR